MNSIDWKTAQAAKAKAGGANPIGSYGDVGPDSGEQPTL
jgi:hypothetical protein